MSQNIKVLDKNITMFMRKTNEVVKCTICGMNCSKPIESHGATSFSGAMAGIKNKHWVSKCKFIDMIEHQDSLILWKRIQNNTKWTSTEIDNFTSQLETLRNKISGD